MNVVSSSTVDSGSQCRYPSRWTGFRIFMPVTSSFPMPKRYGSFRISSYFLPASRAIMHKFLVYHRPHTCFEKKRLGSRRGT